MVRFLHPLPIARPLGEELLLITANRTVRNRYERPSISDLVYQLGRLFVEQENTGQHRGSGPVFGVKLKWTSAGLQNQRLQVRGLALRPFFGLTGAEKPRP